MQIGTSQAAQDPNADTIFVQMSSVHINELGHIDGWFPDDRGVELTYDEVLRMAAHYAPQYDPSEIGLEDAAELEFTTIVFSIVYDHEDNEHKAFVSRLKGFLDTEERAKDFYSKIPTISVRGAMTTN